MPSIEVNVNSCMRSAFEGTMRAMHGRSDSDLFLKAFLRVWYLAFRTLHCDTAVVTKHRQLYQLPDNLQATKSSAKSPPKLGAHSRSGALLLISGTASPMVSFKHSNKAVSTQPGMGTGAVVFASSLSALVSLYPSRRSVTELAR